MLSVPQKKPAVPAQKTASNSRRYKRVETPDGVWVFWRCGRMEDTSRVGDLGPGGLRIVTPKICATDSPVELHFLVEDGGIRVNAAVRYAKAGRGIGLQFKSVSSQDQPRLSGMIKRMFQLAECPF